MGDRILFVDDDPALLAACERLLGHRFELDTANSGKAALAKLTERGPFGVVVADQQMPEMDGVELLATVKQRAPDTMRIMLTGNADLEAVIRVVNEAGIFRLLTKPCQPDVLAKALEEALAQRRVVMAGKGIPQPLCPRTVSLKGSPETSDEQPDGAAAAGKHK